MLTDEVNLEMNTYGVVKSETVYIFTWTTKNGMIVRVISYGATIVSIEIPDKNDVNTDVVLGFDNIDGYLNPINPYMGATVGRVANRTGNAQFKIGNQLYTLSKNVNDDHLHGGIIGFDKICWNYYVKDKSVIFSHVSPNGHEGYPGDVLTYVKYTVTNDNALHIEMKSMTTLPTPINLTNHAYFNLAGHSKGREELLRHEITINASNYTPLNKNLVTTGEIKSVTDTHYDLRTPTPLNMFMPKVTDGYDINFCIDRENDDMVKFAKVYHPKTGICLEMSTNQPGVQFYTSNFFPDSENVMIGKKSVSYTKQGGFCLETQNYPNAVNHENFPNSVIKPGDEYRHEVIYKFSVF